jgi:translation initiation factor RLI1
MAKQIALINYDRCTPLLCDGGVCNAVQECPHGHLIQEAAYEAPEPKPGPCVGCGICVQTCPSGAVIMV